MLFLVIKGYLPSVDWHFVKVWQTHVVAKHIAQIAVIIIWAWQFQTLKTNLFQRIDDIVRTVWIVVCASVH